MKISIIYTVVVKPSLNPFDTKFHLRLYRVSKNVPKFFGDIYYTAPEANHREQILKELALKNFVAVNINHVS